MNGTVFGSGGGTPGTGGRAPLPGSGGGAPPGTGGGAPLAGNGGGAPGSGGGAPPGSGGGAPLAGSSGFAGGGGGGAGGAEVEGIGACDGTGCSVELISGTDSGITSTFAAGAS